MKLHFYVILYIFCIYFVFSVKYAVSFLLPFACLYHLSTDYSLSIFKMLFCFIFVLLGKIVFLLMNLQL